MQLHPEILAKNGKPEFAVLPYEEFVKVRTMLARLTEREMEDPRYGGSWDNLTAEEFAKRQGVKPVKNSADLYADIDPADWEGFEEAVEQWRSEHPRK